MTPKAKVTRAKKEADQKLADIVDILFPSGTLRRLQQEVKRLEKEAKGD
jgi:hypothetical protein